MKPLLLVLLLTFAVSHLNAQSIRIQQAQRGSSPWYADAGVAYGFDVKEFGVRVGAGYELPQIKDFQIGAEAIWYFVDSDTDFYTASLFGQYNLIRQKDYLIYLLAGGHWSQAKFSGSPSFGPTGSGSSSISDFGIVFGGGAEYAITSEGYLFGDLKWNTGDFDQAVLSLGYRIYF